MKRNFFIGLDIGTSSVGFAATDDKYNLLKLGKKVIGVRKFDEASTAEVRRLKRSARRRYDRRQKRLAYLEEMFMLEIAKVDAEFFMRLKESKYLLEDKKIATTNILFNDSGYKDKQFFQEYPTIYHLRAKLFTEKNPDIRKVYLALHHIFKYRGHFTFEGDNFSTESSVENILLSLRDELTLDFENLLRDDIVIEEIASILKNKVLNKLDKVKTIKNKYLGKDVKYEEFFKLAVGSKCSIDKLFSNEDLKEEPLVKLSFSEKIFIEIRDDYVKLLGEDITLLDNAKRLYDAIILANIQESGLTLSETKIKSYEKHKEDKARLKKLIKNAQNITEKEKKEIYSKIFNDDVYANYKSYVGNYKFVKEDKNKTSHKDFHKPGYEDFKTFLVKNCLDKLEDTTEVVEIKKQLEIGTFLPLQRLGDNSVIPYQLHKEELVKILANAEKYYPFLLEKVDGLTTSERIIKLLEFRIPYYVGPLNTYHKDNGGTAWAVKNSNEKVTPWNFEKVVDVEQSAENFIRKMTNKCTYLRGEDVVPKNSLLYSEFELLNELNNLNKNGVRFSTEIRDEIIEELFKKKVQKVTLKKIETFLRARNYLLKGEELRGVDVEIKSNLRSYVELKNILQENFDLELAENVILWLTLFADAKEIFVKKVTAQYGNILSAEKIKELSNLKYTGWGRFSRKLLTEIYSEEFVDMETGELQNIIVAMRKNSLNFMELLSGKYSYFNTIENINKDFTNKELKFDYSLLDDLYISPAVKRSVWQALKVVKEITKFAKKEPQKIFIETTRSGKSEKKRTNSRKKQLEELYKKIKDSELTTTVNVKEKLNAKTEADFRKKKLYLYFTQACRCAYTGEIINIDELNTAAYDIDHIYPRSLTKDDSIHNNLVLVKREVNNMKKDKYPLAEALNITENVKNHWRFLVEKELITKEKYKRLVRVTKLTDEELAGFIERQLVTTSQGTKAVVSILKNIFPNTEIVCVKAENVSEFRNRFSSEKIYDEEKKKYKSVVVNPELLKIRELNDHHHAHDAYLNIVVGNCFNTKFTNNAYNFVKKRSESKDVKKYHYNLDKLYNKNIERNGYLAWDTEKTLNTVLATLRYKWVLVTQKPIEKKGAFYKETLISKSYAKDYKYLPTKMRDTRLQDVTKYGGYGSISIAYNTIISYDIIQKKNIKKIVTILPIPVYLVQTIKTEKDIINYAEKILLQKVNKNIQNINVVYKKMFQNTKININNCYYYVAGRKNSEYFYINTAVQLNFDVKYNEYWKKIVKYNFLNNKYKNIKATDYDIKAEENKDLYVAIIEKMKANVYTGLKTDKFESEKVKELFTNLTVEEQVQILIKMLNILTNKKKEDIKITLLKISVDRSIKNYNLSKLEKFEIIEQSITGLKEKVVKII